MSTAREQSIQKALEAHRTARFYVSMPTALSIRQLHEARAIRETCDLLIELTAAAVPVGPSWFEVRST
jgi:hypothetical protein